MTKEKVPGQCHICGVYGELTREHIPPRKAFNDKRVATVKFPELLTLGPGIVPKGPIRQGGVYFCTLCGKCNNDTGTWYAKDFVDWCYNGMTILKNSGGHPRLIYIQQLYPLRICKQIIAMFLSVNPPNVLRNEYPELGSFILDRQRKGLPRGLRLFAYYSVNPTQFRYVGMPNSRLDIATGEIIFFSEISYPPYGYVLTHQSRPPDDRLAELTIFSKYDYGEMGSFEIRLPVLPTVVPRAGDYRSGIELERDRANARLNKL